MTEQGWLILARNFRHIGFELDIIAKKGGTLMAVEVKARHLWQQNALVDHERLLPAKKRRALERGLRFFVARTHESYKTLRLDLAIVTFVRGRSRDISYHVNI